MFKELFSRILAVLFLCFWCSWTAVGMIFMVICFGKKELKPFALKMAHEIINQFEWVPNLEPMAAFAYPTPGAPFVDLSPEPAVGAVFCGNCAHEHSLAPACATCNPPFKNWNARHASGS